MNNKKIAIKSKEQTEKRIEGWLMSLAHQGTKIALMKIKRYMELETDKDKLCYGQLALEECEMWYYQPNNEVEEKEFELCFLIMKEEKYISNLEMRMEKLKAKLDKFATEKIVHDRILMKYPERFNDWKYNCLADFVFSERNELKEVSSDLDYRRAWIETAKEMITTERYKNIPSSHLEHCNFDFED